MFRQMRRIKQELPLEEAKKLLMKNKRGVISFNGEEGYPYSIPINYFYDAEENKLYFHGAKTGYKLDCIKNNNKSLSLPMAMRSFLKMAGPITLKAWWYLAK